MTIQLQSVDLVAFVEMFSGLQLQKVGDLHGDNKDSGALQGDETHFLEMFGGLWLPKHADIRGGDPDSFFNSSSFFWVIQSTKYNDILITI